MPRRSSGYVAPQPAVMSADQMRSGIQRLEKRLEELNAFDPDTVRDWPDPRVNGLEAAIRTTLGAIFGTDTEEARTYRAASHIDTAGISFGVELPLGEVIAGLHKGKQRAQALLAQAKQHLKEQLDLKEERNWQDQLDANFPLAAGRGPEARAAASTVFVVHGHDDGAKEQVARLIERLGLTAIILHEQPNRGRSVIEKFEQNAIPAAFAVIVVTPDDVGAKTGEEAALKPRARQNVILELGYFYGKLGRANVCTLQKGDVEIPTDILGVIPVMMDSVGAWKLQLAKEMREAGLSVDLNKV